MYTIKLNGASGVIPELDVILRQVFMKRPSLRYLVTKVNKDNLAYVLEVYEGIDHTGRVTYGDYRPMRGETKKVYMLESPKIEKKRHPVDALITTNATTAVKTLLDEEIYAPPGEERKVRDVLMQAEYRMESLVSQASYAFHSPPSAVDVTRFLSKTLAGETIDVDAHFPKIKQFLEKNRKPLEDFDIITEVAKHIEGDNAPKDYSVIKYEIDESISMFSAKSKSIVYNGKSTYELPDWAQSKLTMLKVVEPKQVIRNVGFKFNQDNDEDKALYYVILDGEIPDLIE
jgi:hypothetical protein